MNQLISQRYQKVLVTVAMGFRTEEDVSKNGLCIFTKSQKKDLIEYISSLFSKNKSVVVLKVKKTGYHSFHININTEKELKDFIKNLDDIYEEDNEIWITNSTIIECWRCRIYLSNTINNDLIEMAYSYDDHILDHITKDSKIPYICYHKIKNNFVISNTNLSEEKVKEANKIVQDILYKYSSKFEQIKTDLNFLKINGISLDVRVNNGYDFHDFDVVYKDVEKVIEYYLSTLNNTKKL